jgi:hypothetical protein
MAGLRNGGAVHVDIRSVSTSGSVTAFSDDATAGGGRQVITIGGIEHATILYVNGVGYVKADVPALTGFLGVPQAQAPPLAGRWIALHPGDSIGATTYRSLVDGITLSSVVSEVLGMITAPYKLTAPTTLSGQSVLGIQGQSPVSQAPPMPPVTLYVTAGKGVRPVLFKQDGNGTQQYQMSFSQWGEALNLTAPPGAMQAPSLGPPAIV